MNTVPENVSPVLVDRATQLAFSLQILLQSGLRDQMVWIVRDHLIPAITVQQIAFDFDSLGAPRAVIIWAFLSDEVHSEFSANPFRSFHMSEWNEGTNLWIMNLFGRKGFTVSLLRHVLSSRLSSFDAVSGFRRNSDGSIRGLLTRTRVRSPTPRGYPNRQPIPHGS